MTSPTPHPHPDSSHDDHPSHPSTQVVVLKHTLPDHTHHFDWMIERPNTTHEHRLLTFRCSRLPSLCAKNHEQVFHIEHLPDHRAHYLNYEGELTENRGFVSRVVGGKCVGFWEDSEKSEGRWVIVWDGDDREWVYTRSGGELGRVVEMRENPRN